MGCGGDREKLGNVAAEQKWDYINLSDFKSTSCFTTLSYGILYISLVISLACYAADLFTAINLLIFDRWSGQVEPAIPFNISRWIFAACIILSWVLLAYRWLRAVRAMRSGGVAQSYLDPLAVRIQSIRMGSNGRGWRRFLVFAELTKSKKGSEYVALFTYFSFEAWMRIVLAEGPRNVINALTIYSVMKINIIPTDEHPVSDGHTPIVQFFVNVQLLADSNPEQAAIYFSMLFTLVIWICLALGLLCACLLYIVFLWHHIPSTDGGLSGYCKRKIDSRLHKIVGIKVNKALAKEDTIRSREEGKAGRDGERPPIKRQPTIPVLVTEEDDKLPNMPVLSRQTTQTTLPPYTSRPSTRNDNPLPMLSRQPTLPNTSTDSFRPMPPSRSATQSSAMSNISYASNIPLMGAGMAMGFGPPGRTSSPAPPSRMTSDRSIPGDRPVMDRNATGTSQDFQRPFNPPGQAPPSAQGRITPGPLTRQNTDMSDYASSGRMTPGPLTRQNTDMSDYTSSGRMTPGPPTRANSEMSGYSNARRITPGPLPIDTHGRRTPGQQFSAVGAYGRPTFGAQSIYQQPIQEYEMRSQTPANSIPRLPSINAYVAFNPSARNQPANPTPVQQPAQRNFSAPVRQPQADYFSKPHFPPQRAGTAPPAENPSSYDDSIYDSYGGYNDVVPSRPPMPARAATSGPGGGGAWNGQNWPRPGAY